MCIVIYRLQSYSYNRAIRIYTAFFNYLIDFKELNLKNPFRKATREEEESNPEAISYEEFLKLIALMDDDDNWIKTIENLSKTDKYWLKYAFFLALHTSRRREDIVKLKWSDIKGEIGFRFIESIDNKATRLKRARIPNAKPVKTYVPVTPKFQLVLNELGFDQYQGQDSCILFPDEQQGKLIEDGKIRRHISRKAMMEKMSIGFTHFYKLLKTGKSLKYGSLKRRISLRVKASFQLMQNFLLIIKLKE